MTKIAKGPVAEWHIGRMELGRLSHGACTDSKWCQSDATDLYWYGFNQEILPVSGFVGGSNSIFDGRRAVAQIIRPLVKRLPPTVTCFVEFPTHYVTNAIDEDVCREILNSAPDVLDRTKAVLCGGGYPDDSIVVLRVEASDPTWIAARYRLRTESEVDREANVNDPATRTKLRSVLAANQTVRDRFLLDPLSHMDDATFYAFLSEDGHEYGVENCTFEGLLATPSPEVCARVVREVEDDADPLSDATAAAIAPPETCEV